MDIIGKTVTEYALQRHIDELERENYELRYRLGSSFPFMEKIPLDQEIDVKDINPTLKLAVLGKGARYQMGYSVIARAFNMSKGTFVVGHYFDDTTMYQMSDYQRADYLNVVFQTTARAIADKIYESK